MLTMMPNYTIRFATLEDAPELSRLLTELGHPTSAEGICDRWADWAAEGNKAIVAVEPSGNLIGVITSHNMLVLHRPKPVGRITALVVDVTCRGAGVGKVLVAAVESILIAAGCGLIEITSNDRLVKAHAFYEHLGYERTSIRLAKDLSSFSVDALLSPVISDLGREDSKA